MRGYLTLVLIALATTMSQAQESLPLEKVAALKDATVMITTTVDAGAGTDTVSGSGFLIQVDRQTGYIVTNYHVIDVPKRRRKGESGPNVIFRGGTKRERTAPAEIIASTAEPDLAILKVTGVPELPAPIDVRKEPELVETKSIYVFGFPFGRALAVGGRNPSVVVGRGSISSVRRNDDGRAKSVLIDGALNPGNSGGPVVDAQGRLVGVAVATIRDAHIGLVIAPPELLEMLRGRPGALVAAVKASGKEALEFSVEIPLLDPLGAIKKMTLLYTSARAEAAHAGQEEESTTYKPLPGAKQLALKLEGARGRGTFTVPAPSGKDVDLTYQIAYDDGQGPTLHTKPDHYVLLATRTGDAKPSGLKFTSWGTVLNPDGDCAIRVEKQGLVFEVPAALHDLNPEIGKVNAPRVVQDVEGDFLAQVKVVGEFQPTAPATRANGFPFNGAGLVVWLDADNFVRVERGAISRDGRIGGFFLFERRENGRVTGRHNGFLEEGDVHVKVERRDGRLTAFHSTDGRDWAESEPLTISWPAKLKVGVDAINSSSSPLSVHFVELSIRKLTTEAKR